MSTNRQAGLLASPPGRIYGFLDLFPLFHACHPGLCRLYPLWHKGFQPNCSVRNCGTVCNLMFLRHLWKMLGKLEYEGCTEFFTTQIAWTLHGKTREPHPVSEHLHERPGEELDSCSGAGEAVSQLGCYLAWNNYNILEVRLWSIGRSWKHCVIPFHLSAGYNIFLTLRVLFWWIKKIRSKSCLCILRSWT